MSLKYEPSLEPLHISAKYLLFNDLGLLELVGEHLRRVRVLGAPEGKTRLDPPLFLITHPAHSLVCVVHAASSQMFTWVNICGWCACSGHLRAFRVGLRREAGPHGARPVHLIITLIKWIRTSRLSIKKSLARQVRVLEAPAPFQFWVMRTTVLAIGMTGLAMRMTVLPIQTTVLAVSRGTCAV